MIKSLIEYIVFSLRVHLKSLHANERLIDANWQVHIIELDFAAVDSLGPKLLILIE